MQAALCGVEVSHVKALSLQGVPLNLLCPFSLALGLRVLRFAKFSAADVSRCDVDTIASAMETLRLRCVSELITSKLFQRFPKMKVHCRSNFAEIPTAFPCHLNVMRS